LLTLIATRAHVYIDFGIRGVAGAEAGMRHLLPCQPTPGFENLCGATKKIEGDLSRRILENWENFDRNLFGA
jgi:hypothetical protein